jgi:type VI secretion system (T6SS) phospholipase Tle1-like effector
MPRKLVVCMDGTWNKPGQEDESVKTETNVLKLSRALAKLPDQICGYFKGVGTEAGEKAAGGAIGWGLFAQIKDGYRFLREQFQPGDRVYIFGFSRGAYSARSLAGMVLRCGILRRDASPEFPDLGSDLLTTQDDGNLRTDAVDRVFALYKRAYEEQNRPQVERFKQQYCHDTTVRCVGVWDTVGALGLPRGAIRFLDKFDKALDEKLYAFLDTDLSPRVEAAYHAVAIDEHRKPFVPTLWTDPKGAAPRINVAGSNVEQVWFVGAHSNVGGGYADTGLSDIALKWMIDRATKNGLKFDAAALSAIRPAPLAKRRDSLGEFIEIGGEKNRLFGWIDGLASRYIATDRQIVGGSCVHESVNGRLAAPSASEPGSDSPYQPAKTLKTSQAGGTRSVDPSLRVVS